jgi:hypothetical protein
MGATNVASSAPPPTREQCGHVDHPHFGVYGHVLELAAVWYTRDVQHGPLVVVAVGFQTAKATAPRTT